MIRDGIEVKSRTTKDFRDALDALPEDVQRLARKAYLRFSQDPYHPSLRFKRVHPVEPVWSARVGAHYRVLGLRREDRIVWFWIGSHAEYDRVTSML